MNLRDNPVVIERGHITASQFLGKRFEEDDVWAFITSRWPQVSTEWAEAIHSAAWQELEVQVEKSSIIASYDSVKDKASLLVKYIRAMDTRHAVILHDYLAGKM